MAVSGTIFRNVTFDNGDGGSWSMSDYTRMSAYYDLIMTNGYYDYDEIVCHLEGFGRAQSILEIGSGTGLILHRLVSRRPELTLAGVDVTAAMLDIAIERLRPHPQVTLHRQDIVELCLGRSYDVAFSYGGVWYFVPDGKGKGFSMISHLRDDRDNQQGFERVAGHLSTGGTLLLGIQSAHRDYSSPVTDSLEYSQRIIPIDGGFRKQYSLTDDGHPVMAQTIDYRTYAFDEAIALLDKCGFDYRAPAEPAVGAAPLFLEFGKR
jgi:SAM-dependent methyltransferase